jgi:hypothetical protein
MSRSCSHFDSHLVYVKLNLRSRVLNGEARSLLESVGVECLDQGGDFEAYGIVPSEKIILNLLSHMPGIRSAEIAEPPVGI